MPRKSTYETMRLTETSDAHIEANAKQLCSSRFRLDGVLGRVPVKTIRLHARVVRALALGEWPPQK